MTSRFAHALTRLYAPDWRARYGREFQAMLESLQATPALVLNVFVLAFWSRRRAAAIASLAILLLLAALPQRHPNPGSHVAVARHLRSPSIASACRAYSSTTAGGWITRGQCLD